MFKNKEGDKSILICECHNLEHQICVFKDEDDDVAYVSIHLVPGTFFERLKNGIKYIFGHRSRYGDFDEFLFKKEHGDFLIDLGNFLNKNKSNEKA